MRELPILLDGEMARATIDGRKTQTRRPVKLAEGLEAYHIDEWRSIDGHDLWQPWGDCGMCNGASTCGRRGDARGMENMGSSLSGIGRTMKRMGLR